MPKVKEFYHVYKKLSVTRRKRLRCASETITLVILGTSNLRAPLELFEEELLILR